MDKFLTLPFLPPETLELILENTNGLEFMLLWMCGDKNLCERLSRCHSLAIEWDGVKACPWPSFWIQNLKNLQSFSLTYSEYIRSAFAAEHKIELLPTTLKVLKLSFYSKQLLSNSIAKLFPNLNHLMIDRLEASFKEPICLPSTLQRLELGQAADLLQYTSFQTLLSSLPLLTHLRIPDIKADESPFVWPEYLEYCAVSIEMKLSLQTPMTFYFGQALPSGLKHLALDLQCHTSLSDPQVRYFPWELLPASLLSMTCEGILNPPTVFPLKLEHFTYTPEPFRMPIRLTESLFLELLRKAPPTLKSFNVGTFGSPLKINYEYLDAGYVPRSLETIEIASIPLFTKLPRLTPSITSLLLAEACQSVVEDKSIVLPETLTSLTIEKCSGPFPLCWSLPRRMTTLKLSKYPYDPLKGASGLPPNLTDLQCCTAAFPESSNLADIPASITRLSLLIVNIYSFMPVKSGERRPFGDIIQASTAKDLPKGLKYLYIKGNRNVSSSITTWFSELDSNLPLIELQIDDTDLTVCKAFLNLPPTLRVLIAPTAQYSGKYYSTLPRNLRVLHLLSVDSHYLDTKLEHLKDLPRGIVDIDIFANKSVTEQDLRRAFPFALLILLNFTMDY